MCVQHDIQCNWGQTQRYIESEIDLYAELPEIDKYPLAVEGNGDIDIEIFTSGEKAGKDNDSWLIDVANSFNGSGVKTADGKSVSMSVRSIA